MKIIILTPWFSERMGYIENCLPKAMAKKGHDVHVISSTAQVYYDSEEYETVYEPFLGKNILPPATKQIDGYTLHRIPFRSINKKIVLKGLRRKIKEIQPDVVQVFDAFSVTTLQAAYCKLFHTFKLFTANHTVASVFPLYRKNNPPLYALFFYLSRTLPGFIISKMTSRCYPATIDALEIAVKYYGIPESKAKLLPLGVDTDFFKPIGAEAQNSRDQERKNLGVNSEELLCIYTGRFTEGKNPLCLAKAINELSQRGEPFKALFMGDGPQRDEIATNQGCIVHPFVPYHQLPSYYGTADIGIWPRQESTSMIDAAACGIPIVISNKVQATERVEGNGLTYEENQAEDLAQKLIQLKDQALRNQLSTRGVEKVRSQFSWDKLAEERLKDYAQFVV